MSGSSLDPAAVQVANRQLWAAHPELKGRQLTNGPEDRALALEWSKLYREARAPQPAVVFDPADVTPVAPCPPEPKKAPECKGSLKHEACKKALEDGLDRDGNKIDEETLERLRYTRDRINRMRMIAVWQEWNKGVAALDAYLDGCGKFVEIPKDKVDQVKTESTKPHRDKFLKKLTDEGGIKSKLALELSKRSTAPAELEFQMDFSSGTQNPQGELDDKLAYYGSTIHSQVTIKATQTVGERGCYDCVITSWKSWVEDNYDWEGNKQFGASWLGFVRPTQVEMKEFGDFGCAQPYQRSSPSWQEPIDPTKVVTKVCYGNKAELDDSAKRRKDIEDARAKQQADEAAEGALPQAPPAEDASK